MKIIIEKRKAAGGKLSIRLVYYYGHKLDESGKVKHTRDREKLDLFLYEKPRTSIERQHNKETLQLVEAIKAKRLVEHQSGRHDFKTSNQVSGSFFDLFESLNKQKESLARSTYNTWMSSYKQLRKFDSRPELTFEDVTPEYVERFKNYLQFEAATKREIKLTQATAGSYFSKFRAVINDAVKKGFISPNPLSEISNIKAEDNKREYLEISELRRLVETPCRNDILRRAFLFSCITGLRFSDIQKLLWTEVVITDTGQRIVFNQQKTKGLQHLDLSDQAYSLLSDRESSKPFYGLKYSSYNNVDLLRWCRDAGISKHITFHCGRHTFAVVQLNNGVDIYTVSKLLGHSELKTTQIYADIIDVQRKEAMLKIPDIGL